jgi:hypothetical protein
MRAPRRFLLLAAPCLAAVASTAPVSAQAPPVAAPLLKWQYAGCFASWCQTGWYASPAVADFEGDGQPEVVWGSYDLVVVNGSTGTLRARATNASRVWPAVAVADLDGDGTLEIAVGRGGNQLTVYRPVVTSGTMTLPVAWSASPFSAGHEVRTLAVDDLDGNGTREVIVGRAGNGDTLQVSVYEAGGALRAGWPARHVGDPGYGWGMYNENVTVADLDGDGQKEIYAPTDTHYITALHPSGTQLGVSGLFAPRTAWSEVGVHVDQAADLRGYANCGTEHRPNFANMGPGVADLDGDGTLEVMVPGDAYDCSIGDGPGDYAILPWIFKRDRTRWSGSGFDWTVVPSPEPGSGPLSEDYNVIENSVSNAVLADLDGDGRKEILYAAYDGRVHAWWLDKTQHGNWPFKVPGAGMHFATEPVVADLNGDGAAEVIFASWDEKSLVGSGKLYVLDAGGNLLHEVPLPVAKSAGEWSGSLAAPTLANIDADPDYELVLGTVAAGLVAYDLPGTAAARVRWGTGRGGMQRTGLAPDMIFADGFDLGGTARWSTAATGGGDLTVSPSAALSGGQGLQAVVNDTAALYVQDDGPTREGRYRARFRLDPNGFDPGEAASHFRTRVFIAFQEVPLQRLATVVLRRLGGQYALGVRVRLDDGTRAATPFVDVTDAPHTVEIDWRRATAPNANDGRLELFVDGVLRQTLPALDNDLGRVDFARLGALSVKVGAAGTLYYDGFESRRRTYIGP